MAACSDEKIQGCIALQTVTDLWNILRRVPDASRRSALRSICELLEVVGTAHDEVISAIEMAQFKDFEDCVQTKCAKASKADYIVTRNVSDFQFSEIPVLSPEDALRIINS